MDIAARNCLLHEQNLVKIADFGLTQRMDPGKTVHTLRTTIKLSMKWLAPEVLDTKCLSGTHFAYECRVTPIASCSTFNGIHAAELTDVWSFGVTMWEIFSYGAMPYKEVQHIMTHAVTRFVCLQAFPYLDSNIARLQMLRSTDTCARAFG